MSRATLLIRPACVPAERSVIGPVPVSPSGADHCCVAVILNHQAPAHPCRRPGRPAMPLGGCSSEVCVSRMSPPRAFQEPLSPEGEPCVAGTCDRTRFSSAAQRVSAEAFGSEKGPLRKDPAEWIRLRLASLRQRVGVPGLRTPSPIPCPGSRRWSRTRFARPSGPRSLFCPSTTSSRQAAGPHSRSAGEPGCAARSSDLPAPRHRGAGFRRTDF